MAALIVNQGLQVIGGRASNTADAFAAIQSMSVDDDSQTGGTAHTGFQAADTTLRNGGTSGPTNLLTKAFDATPTRSSQTVSHVTTFGTSEANFTIKRVALHFAASGSVNATSATLVGGIDGQSLTKTSSFTLKITVDIAYTSP